MKTRPHATEDEQRRREVEPLGLAGDGLGSRRAWSRPPRRLGGAGGLGGSRRCGRLCRRLAGVGGRRAVACGSRGVGGRRRGRGRLGRRSRRRALRRSRPRGLGGAAHRLRPVLRSRRTARPGGDLRHRAAQVRLGARDGAAGIGVRLRQARARGAESALYAVAAPRARDRRCGTRSPGLPAARGAAAGGLVRARQIIGGELLADRARRRLERAEAAGAGGVKLGDDRRAAR